MTTSRPPNFPFPLLCHRSLRSIDRSVNRTCRARRVLSRRDPPCDSVASSGLRQGDPGTPRSPGRGAGVIGTRLMNAKPGVRESGDCGKRGNRHRSGCCLDHDRRHDPAGPQRGIRLAGRGESGRRLRQDRGGRALAPAGHDRPQGSRRLRRRRRGDRRGGRAQGRAARDHRRGLPGRRPRDHHLLAQHRRDRQGAAESTASSSASTSSTRCRG